MEVASGGYLPKRRGKYPPVATDAEVNSCFSIYQNSEIIQHKKTISTHLVLQRLGNLWEEIPRELLEGEYLNTIHRS